MGRPTDYNEDVADTICSLIKMGKTIDEICSLDSMPCRSTYYIWQKEYADFMDKCNDAETKSADAIYQNGLREVQELPRVKAWQDENGQLFSDDQVKELTAMDKSTMGLEKVGLSSELVARAKLIMDTAKHFAAIRNPDKYSEKRQVQVNGNIAVKSFLAGLEDE